MEKKEISNIDKFMLIINDKYSAAKKFIVSTREKEVYLEIPYEHGYTWEQTKENNLGSSFFDSPLSSIIKNSAVSFSEKEEIFRIKIILL